MKGNDWKIRMEYVFRILKTFCQYYSKHLQPSCIFCSNQVFECDITLDSVIYKSKEALINMLCELKITSGSKKIV